MAFMNGLDGLRSYGRVSWDARERGWIGDPDEIVAALAREGFQALSRCLTPDACAARLRCLC